MNARGIAPSAVLALALTSACIAPACIDRPVVPIDARTDRVSITPLRVTKVDKVDLLIVVDNSSSMKDKQAELGRRIPELISALTTPSVDPKTGRTTSVADIHVGVITSSLGSYGTGVCSPARYGVRQDDGAHLLPRVNEAPGSGGFVVDGNGTPIRATCPAPQPGKPLTWAAEPGGDARFVGAAGALELQAATSCVVESAEQDGCGYEATWEAIYRFLVEPSPYLTAAASCTSSSQTSESCTGGIAQTGRDTALLAQRAAFLRDDSLLAVIVLSDENDFSLKPTADHYLPWSSSRGTMARALPGCTNVPDDLEPDDAAGHALLKTTYGCASCATDPSAPGCSAPWSPLTASVNGDIDGFNLRGFHQVQRYGRSFLWSRQRYVDAFTQTEIVGADGKLAPNPIFRGGRSQDLVVVAGIVGVPKHLVSGADGAPKSLDAAAWEKIVSPDLAKRDPHMIESIAPRTGIAKYQGDRSIDAVNGGDRDVPDGDDLQYACIAPRANGTSGGDACSGPTPSPLCEGTSQTYFKAFPGLRHLRILKELGASGFVASICSESYRPAIRGIVDKIKVAVVGQCIKSDLTADATGNVSCLIVEAMADSAVEGESRCEDIGPSYCTPGATPCRREGSDYPPISAEAAAAQLTLPIPAKGPDGITRPTATTAIAIDGNVYAKTIDGKKHLVCEMLQLAGDRVPAAETTACQHDPSYVPTNGGGWCYTQDPAVIGDHCAKNGSPGSVRFFGDAPKNGSDVFTLCLGG